ncbi:hypothetical protein BJY04DRAFT_200898 [Aspergillus karnatakaensis]|uniref:uncharacterized protein n=1 Tax=Aspergillus karnatakaensis TaxID=1810916 RepID=UPI003CCD1238
MAFQARRPKSALLVPSKRPLSAPRKPLSIASHLTPALKIRDSLQADPSEAKAKEMRRSEIDFSATPQPFLDPGLWEKLNAEIPSGS